MKVERLMMKDEGKRLKDEGRMLKDEGLRLKGVLRTDRRTDICDCRVAFATEKVHFMGGHPVGPSHIF